MTIQVGQSLPQSKLKVVRAGEIQDVDSSALLGKGTVVVFGVPGAFTPTCDAKHLPGYLAKAAEFAGKGVATIACFSVNDAFVMKAWAKASGVATEVVMIADGNGDYTRALGLGLDVSAYGMGQRCKRFALVATDGVVKHLFVEEGGDFKVSAAEYVLERLNGGGRGRVRASPLSCGGVS
jgi:glutaredoxin/glutathione-dependent peroxiredoxin